MHDLWEAALPLEISVVPREELVSEIAEMVQNATLYARVLPVEHQLGEFLLQKLNTARRVDIR